MVKFKSTSCIIPITCSSVFSLGFLFAVCLFPVCGQEHTATYRGFDTWFGYYHWGEGYWSAEFRIVWLPPTLAHSRNRHPCLLATQHHTHALTRSHARTHRQHEFPPMYKGAVKCRGVDLANNSGSARCEPRVRNHPTHTPLTIHTPLTPLTPPTHRCRCSFREKNAFAARVQAPRSGRWATPTPASTLLTCSSGKRAG